MITLTVGTATHVGMVRDVNQDRVLAVGPLVVVADGMGGHSGGEVAAEIAVEVFAGAVPPTTSTELVGLVEQANAEIVERARDAPGLRGMGTTICVLADLGEQHGVGRLGIANVGDSRLYRLTREGLHQHTEDHSLVESLVRDGRLSREEAQVHPQRNIVTRALGIDGRVLVDAWELAPVRGDRYLLCSDGLYGEVPEPEIHTALFEIESVQAAADHLVRRACEAGGRDNVTVAVVDVLEAGPVVEVPADRVVADHRALSDAASTDAGPQHGAGAAEGAPPARRFARRFSWRRRRA